MMRYSLVLSAVCLLVACTTENLEYCDERRNCTIPNTICDFEQKRCVPKPPPDAGPDGVDLGADQRVGDQGPSEAGTDGMQPDTQQLKTLGEPCLKGDECEQGFCVDGVCCGSACAGSCVACDLAGSEGKCTPYAADTDPEGECQGGHSDCVGSCDGSGSCSYAAKLGNACGAPVCAAGELETGVCNAAGGCDRSKQSCGGYACDAGKTACLTSCNAPGDCTGVFQCLNKACIADLALGQVCGSNNKACKSGNCVDGVCCSTGSCGACNRCDIAGKEGTCSPEPNGTSCGADSCVGDSFLVPSCQGGACKTASTPCAPFTCNAGGTACAVSCSKDSDCVGGNYCDAGGKCVPKKGNGLACGGANECTSNICTVEGFCCDRACNGECETCAGKPACAFKAPGTKCGPADTCKDTIGTSFIESHACDGLSASCKKTTAPCDPYACGSGASCKTSCANNDDCSSKICRFWAGSPHSCAPASDICYVDSSAGSGGGSGTILDPRGDPSSCGAEKKVIGVYSGNYSGFLIADDVTVSGIETGSTLYSGATLTVGAVLPGIRVSAGKTTRLVGLDIGGIEAAGAASVEMLRVRVKGPSIGINAPNVASLKLDDVSIEDCAAGIVHSGAQLTLSNVRVAVTTGSGPAVDLTSASVSATDLTVDSANAIGLRLGGAFVFDRVVVRGSGARGIVFESGSSGSMTNALVVNNGADGIYYGAGGSSVVLQYATIADNGDLGAICDSPGLSISNSIIFNNATGAISGADCQVTYSASDDSSVNGTGTLQISDPKLVSATDFHLQATSPCIDKAADLVTGAPNPTTDLDGLPRKVDKKGLTNKSDMGAYELQ